MQEHAVTCVSPIVDAEEKNSYPSKTNSTQKKDLKVCPRKMNNLNMHKVILITRKYINQLHIYHHQEATYT